MPHKRPTIDDVAARSGVARTTVSRVINGGANVREEVRERVQRVIEELDFRVNMQARSLAGGGGRQLALIHPSDLESEPNSYYHSGLEIGALRACAERGFVLLTQSVDPSAPISPQRIGDLITSRRCEGVILTPPFSDDLALIRQLKTLCTVVCISAGIEARAEVSSVGIDDEGAGFAMTQFLLDKGHRRFGYIGGPADHRSAALRYDGFLRALREAGCPDDAVHYQQGNFTFRSGIDGAMTILNRDDRPTALVCANDDMAAGALLTAHKLDLNIPEQVSIVGFDDTPVSEIVWPPMTTVHQPIRQLGQMAVQMLADAISDQGGGVAISSQLAPFQIVPRSSAGMACDASVTA